MPKEYGVKDKDRTVDFIVGELLNGRLRSFDRIDRTKIAETLGVSRIPVQEAVVQLETDGLLTSTYHKGVYVERFDAAIVREHHEVFGALSAIVSSRAARDPTEQLLADLGRLVERMQSEDDSAHFEELGWQFRRLLNATYAGPRLRAAIRSSQTFIPKLFWVAESDNRHIMERYYRLEREAIRDRQSERAGALCLERSAAMAEAAIGALTRAGVFDPEESVGSATGS